MTTVVTLIRVYEPRTTITVTEAGTPGVNGRTILSGSGAPSIALGVDGDFYWRLDTNAFHGPKGLVSPGLWPTPPLSLVGPAGTPALAAGALRQVQFHGAGAVFAADPGLTYDLSTDVLTVLGSVVTPLINATTRITSGNGSAASPAYSFTGDPDNGVYLSATNQVAISTGGADRLRTDSAITEFLSVQVGVPGGSAASPGVAFTGDLNTGVFRSGADDMRLATNGATRAGVSNSGFSVANTGGTGHLLKQTTSGGVFSSGQLALGDIPNGLITAAKGASEVEGTRIPHLSAAGSDGNFASIANGILYADSLNNRLAVRINGTWFYASLTPY